MMSSFYDRTVQEAPSRPTQSACESAAATTSPQDVDLVCIRFYHEGRIIANYDNVRTDTNVKMLKYWLYQNDYAIRTALNKSDFSHAKWIIFSSNVELLNNKQLEDFRTSFTSTSSSEHEYLEIEIQNASSEDDAPPEDVFSTMMTCSKPFYDQNSEELVPFPAMSSTPSRHPFYSTHSYGHGASVDLPRSVIPSRFAIFRDTTHPARSSVYSTRSHHV
jgi:hypothetical protein